MDSNRDTPKNVQSTWKKQVAAHFSGMSPDPSAQARWRELVLESTTNSTKSAPPALNWFKQHKSQVIAPVVSALIAASVTFMIVGPQPDEPLDPIAELAQLPGPKVYPPDFDLEGDSKAMNDIVFELFADKDFFASDLPAQVLAEYQPNEGRFFSWDGEPAVSIQMNRSAAMHAKKANEPATLLIVKLSEKSRRKFPKEKLTRKIAGKSGKMRKVKVWREGNFGYAMVQDSLPLTDTP